MAVLPKEKAFERALAAIFLFPPTFKFTTPGPAGASADFDGSGKGRNGTERYKKVRKGTVTSHGEFTCQRTTPRCRDAGHRRWPFFRQAARHVRTNRPSPPARVTKAVDVACAKSHHYLYVGRPKKSAKICDFSADFSHFYNPRPGRELGRRAVTGIPSPTHFSLQARPFVMKWRVEQRDAIFVTIRK